MTKERMLKLELLNQILSMIDLDLINKGNTMYIGGVIIDRDAIKKMVSDRNQLLNEFLNPYVVNNA